MKIGVLTFSAALNYGAQLQAFALCVYLRSLGHEVSVIQYSPKYLTAPYGLFRRFLRKRSILSFIKQLIITVLEFVPFVKRKKKMREFQRKFFSLTKKITTSSDISHEFRCVVVGSDQIWNKELTGGKLDECFFLKNYTGKKYSYAASFSPEICSEDDFMQMAEYLNKFEKISVRESGLQTALLKFVNKNISVCIDPTFLLKKEEWLNFLPPQKEREPYIVVYQARGIHSISDNIVRQLSAQLGVRKVINLSGNGNTIFKRDRLDVSPLEFVQLIKNAECVISISFHGVAISVIMETPFYYIFLNDGRNERIENLLNRIGLANRIVKPEDKICFSRIDYEPYNKQIGFLCEESVSFIKSITENG